MNKTAYFGLSYLISMVTLLISCQDEIFVVIDGPPETIVYGLINPDDSIHYVRLTRSFVGSGSAEEMAKNPDNLYYNNVVMALDINSPEGYPLKSFEMEKVILDDRQEGLFATSPNIMYRYAGGLKSYLNEGYKVRLSIILKDQQRLVSAQQVYRIPPAILNPKRSNQSYLSFYFSDPLRVEWEDIYGFKKYEITVRFNYSDHLNESNRTGNVDIRSILYSNISGEDQKDQTLSHYLNGDDLYRQIGLKINDDIAVVNRSFISIDIIINSVGEDFCTYQETNSISSDRMGKPVTDIIGGMGIFALKTITMNKGYLLDPISLDSLVNGQFTKHLRFVKW